MFFMKKFKEIEENEKNPVNKMYLQELLLQLKSFIKLEEIENIEDKYQKIADAITKFVTSLSNPKYRYNSQTTNGFKPNSPVFSSIYLDDVIYFLIKNQPILKNKGVIFDKISFDSNIRFKPDKLINLDKYPMLSFEKSEEILQIAQKIEIQYRPSGKRTYNKYNIVLPIMLFSTQRILTKDKFNNALKIIKKATKCFEKAKMIIVCETIHQDFFPEIKDKEIDSVFVLRKQFYSQKLQPIDPEILKKLEQRIDYILQDFEPDYKKMIEKGVIY